MSTEQASIEKRRAAIAAAVMESRRANSRLLPDAMNALGVVAEREGCDEWPVEVQPGCWALRSGSVSTVWYRPPEPEEVAEALATRRPLASRSSVPRTEPRTSVSVRSPRDARLRRLFAEMN